LALGAPQVCKSASLQVCKSASLQVCKSASLQVCKSASLQVHKAGPHCGPALVQLIKMYKIKDAGIVYKSFRIETNRVIWSFWSYESNPQNKSFEHCWTKRIHETNLLNIVDETIPQNHSFKHHTDSRIWIPRICMDSSCSLYVYVLRIRQDLWGFVGFMKTGWIFEKLCHKSNPQDGSFEHHSRIRFANPVSPTTYLDLHSTGTNLLATNQDSRIESMDLQNKSMFLRISYTIPAALKK
jgi:hypothetical protein